MARRVPPPPPPTSPAPGSPPKARLTFDAVHRPRPASDVQSLIHRSVEAHSSLAAIAPCPRLHGLLGSCVSGPRCAADRAAERAGNTRLFPACCIICVALGLPPERPPWGRPHRPHSPNFCTASAACARRSRSSRPDSTSPGTPELPRRRKRCPHYRQVRVGLRGRREAAPVGRRRQNLQ